MGWRVCALESRPAARADLTGSLFPRTQQHDPGLPARGQARPELPRRAVPVLSVAHRDGIAGNGCPPGRCGDALAGSIHAEGKTVNRHQRTALDERHPSAPPGDGSEWAVYYGSDNTGDTPGAIPLTLLLP